jgi:FKBP-type peptidyl-prolyl cis-trans isomerase FkpA
MLARLRGLFTRHSAPDFALPADSELTRTESGLGYRIIEPGSGRAPTVTDRVTVRYAGWLMSGRPFDASYPRTSTFHLGRVIRGWNEGLQLMMVGGKGWFVVPPELGYGATGAPPLIGPNETLVFHIELVKLG